MRFKRKKDEKISKRIVNKGEICILNDDSI